MMQNQKWQASPLLKASAALHVGAAASALVWPGSIGFGIASVIANHVVLASAGLWPRSSLLGPNVLRLPHGRDEIALTIDDGPDPEVTPRVLDILAEKNVRATFFCIAAKVKNQPALVWRIVDEGHHIENHSMQHRHYFSMMGMGGIKRELVQAQQVIEDATGRRPQFFRAPAGLRNPFLDPVLHQLDLRLVSWTRRGFDTRIHDAAKITQRLLANAKAGDILLLHDGNAARSKNGQAVILEVLPQLIDRLSQQNLRFVSVEEGMRADC
ncbi:chitin deacetylase [Herminiimonas fonticola]|uniref:Chitin deacetylase n=2 Tax=Herminiimonas fonticola TaxID=303380 RepID=A0A4V3BWH0_9BURK|nr:polysaccharide deacetylase family protein [Herminiimonas fonticola]RBA25053.1 putative xylanase/chitin deacetylase [Herminiimonas fonticola]TDN94168.1 chitin deacetylase [Herminiimonas fonticola]